MSSRTLETADGKTDYSHPEFSKKVLRPLSSWQEESEQNLQANITMVIIIEDIISPVCGNSSPFTMD